MHVSPMLVWEEHFSGLYSSTPRSHWPIYCSRKTVYNTPRVSHPVHTIPRCQREGHPRVVLLFVWYHSDNIRNTYLSPYQIHTPLPVSHPQNSIATFPGSYHPKPALWILICHCDNIPGIHPNPCRRRFHFLNRLSAGCSNIHFFCRPQIHRC